MKKIDEMLVAFGIEELKNRYTGPLSAGQMARLMLAKAFLPDPQVVLLDEPTAPLDPEVAQDVRHFLLAEKKRRGVSFIFTSHNMDEVAFLCDRVLVFKNGQIFANESPRNLAASVKKARLDLIITDGMERALQIVLAQQLPYELIDNRELKIDLDEQQVAPLLIELARAGVTYIHLSVEKPTLQDYFIQVAKRR